MVIAVQGARRRSRRRSDYLCHRYRIGPDARRSRAILDEEMAFLVACSSDHLFCVDFLPCVEVLIGPFLAESRRPGFFG